MKKTSNIIRLTALLVLTAGTQNLFAETTQDSSTSLPVTTASQPTDSSQQESYQQVTAQKKYDLFTMVVSDGGSWPPQTDFK